jgi:hypothetical protein
MNHVPINQHAAFRALSEERRKEAPMIRKTLLAASAAALMSTPAWALPSQASTHATGHGPSTTPKNVDNPGRGHDNGNQSGTPSTHGNSHKCKPQSVGFIVSGTLVSQTLTLNSDGTYSGNVVVTVTRTNHHAAEEKLEKVNKTFPLVKVHVTFGLADTNANGAGLDDLKALDRVMLIGKVTKLAKKCHDSKFTAQKTIRKVVFNDPATA